MKDFVLSEPVGGHQLSINYEAELNAEQLAVVTAPAGPMLVLAGAGSGKTRAITYRVAWLLEHGVSPDHILLLTFTNKAAGEMVKRVELLLGSYPTGLYAGTFHSVANRLLRRYAERLGYGANFSILDEEDAKDLIGLCVKELKIDTKARKFPSSGVLKSIDSYARNKAWDLEKSLEHSHASFLPMYDQIKLVLDMYKSRKLAQNAMDFDDLLLNLLELIEKHDDVRTYLSNQFENILVDEFQDTNVIQARIVKRLSEVHGNILAVGDDAQSIYSFRAAEVRNMLDFKDAYPGAQMFRLLSNYRSTPQILAVANAVIKQNREQFSKELHAARDNGELPVVVPAGTPNEEARYIADQIGIVLMEGTSPDQIAVLFRSSFHSQSLEFELMRRGLSYEYRGGMKFFERAHVKDAVAHLRIMSNVKDAMAWVRALKLHPGLGLVGAGKIANVCSSAGTLDEALACTPRGAKAASGFAACVRVLAGMREVRNVSDMIRAFTRSTEYSSYLEAEYPDATDRIDDLEQFAIFAEPFEKLEDFLEAVTLTDDFGAARESVASKIEPKLILSTIHQAKGLEWEHVFVIHLCEGSFPHNRSMSDERELEEERRLFYVAATRAREHLYLTYPMAVGFDTIEAKQPSMFLHEIPEGCYERIRLRSSNWSTMPSRSYPARDTYSDDSVIVLDDLGERSSKPMPSSFLRNIDDL